MLMQVMVQGCTLHCLPSNDALLQLRDVLGHNKLAKITERENLM
jgi:hypothetical protein